MEISEFKPAVILLCSILAMTESLSEYISAQKSFE